MGVLDDLGNLASQFAGGRVSEMEKAADFYDQHPTLVKTIGAGALALLMSRMSRARR